jgi:hypothetical protein
MELHVASAALMRSYFVEVEKSSMVLAQCTAEPLPLKKRLALTSQGLIEHEAHLTYLDAKSLLLNAARLGYGSRSSSYSKRQVGKRQPLSRSMNCGPSLEPRRRTLRQRLRPRTNAFSRELDNHAASVALGYFAYNFIKIHRTLRTTPAMAAGVTDRLWEVSDLVALVEASERGLEAAQWLMDGLTEL